MRNRLLGEAEVCFDRFANPPGDIRTEFVQAPSSSCSLFAVTHIVAQGCVKVEHADFLKLFLLGRFLGKATSHDQSQGFHVSFQSSVRTFVSTAICA
jgi:hypothetical protein